MFVDIKVADHFKVNANDLHFDEDCYFVFSRSCTVAVKGKHFDVFFDENYNITDAFPA